MNNLQAIERAYSISLVDAMTKQASAKDVLSQVDPGSDGYEYAETIVFAFDNIINAIIERAKGDGIWTETNTEAGPCLRAFIVTAGTR